MKRRKRISFKNPKMMSSRIESDIFTEFEKLIRYRDCSDLQTVMNTFVDQYVSGNLYLSGSRFCVK